MGEVLNQYPKPSKQNVNDAKMQKWEYKTLYRRRGWKGGMGWHEATPWNETIELVLPKLGMEGWELVAVVPLSSTQGEGCAGFTDEEMWVFKRPLA